LASVYEDPSGLAYQTSYSYDVLDDLTQVSQGLQTRTLVYNSLKQLTSGTSPESGTVSYPYDANGDLTQKTDARGVEAVGLSKQLASESQTADLLTGGGVNIEGPGMKRAVDDLSRLLREYGGDGVRLV
jgi:YD repeat-containing protein